MNSNKSGWIEESDVWLLGHRGKLGSIEEYTVRRMGMVTGMLRKEAYLLFSSTDD